MGRMIDADVLREEVCSWGMNDYEPSDFTDAIDDAPTVEAIPKADYENRLKADMVDMLEELQLEIEEQRQDNPEFNIWKDGYNTANDIDCVIIQQKISSLKEN